MNVTNERNQKDPIDINDMPDEFKPAPSISNAQLSTTDKTAQISTSSQVLADAKDISPDTRPTASLRALRIGVSVFFLLHGLSFASWASRIPTIQARLQLSESALGSILFALPLGFFISLPFSGWLIARLNSKRVVILSAIGYSLGLISIGLSSSGVQVAASLLVFGFFANMLNISMNTQAVAVEHARGKRMLASFHGLWSLAGFAGAAIGAWMIAQEISPLWHFICIASVFIPGLIFATPYLAPRDRAAEQKQSLLALPDKTLLGLGLIAFCSMMVEGGMFDWSGIYMSKVVNAGAERTALGYTVFMVAMTSMRFLADLLAARFGLKRTLQLSGSLSATGLLLAVLFPQYAVVLFAFALIGLGVAAVVPMAYSAAGKSRTMAPGTAITAVSSLGFMGFLIGPPTIGFIAGAATLRGSFVVLVIMATAVVLLASLQRFEDRS